LQARITVVSKSGKEATIALLSQGAFSPIEFLSKAGIGRTMLQLKQKEAFFSQGEKADSVFYLQKGSAKITVVSKSGKEAYHRATLSG
jgi:CRP/FNR family cyclic AMP-dependent transcriptional regulator